MITTTVNLTSAMTLDALDAAVEKLRGVAPVKWLLIAPDGRIYAAENPRELVPVLAAAAHGIDVWPVSPPSKL